jgi:hypothetical protein
METKEIVERMRKEISRHHSYRPAYVYYFDGKVVKQSSGACHSMFNSKGSVNQSPVIGVHIPWENKKRDWKVGQDFLSWLFSDDSVYKPFFDFLGKNLEIVRKDGDILGFISKTNQANVYTFQSLCKATRTVGEHHRRLDFWKKWAMDRGVKNKSLVFLMSYFYNTRCEQSHSCHSVFNYQGIDITPFLNPNHKKWKLTDETAFLSNCGYSGEGEINWGGKDKRNIYKIIPKAGVKKLKTRFWGKYHGNPTKKTDKDFLEFFNSYEGD